MLAMPMFERIATAKVKLVTIIASSELQDRIIEGLREAGAGGYTITRASGGGLHGPRLRGIWDTGNVRIEALVSTEVAERVLEHITEAYAELPFIAFAVDVEAVPREHFLEPSRGPRLR
jgi:nitrogen regulatory protein PII